MNQQVDIAVDLGAVPPPLPEILSLRQLVEAAPPSRWRWSRFIPRQSRS